MSASDAGRAAAGPSVDAVRTAAASLAGPGRLVAPAAAAAHESAATAAAVARRACPASSVAEVACTYADRRCRGGRRRQDGRQRPAPPGARSPPPARPEVAPSSAETPADASPEPADARVAASCQVPRFAVEWWAGRNALPRPPPAPPRQATLVPPVLRGRRVPRSALRLVVPRFRPPPARGLCRPVRARAGKAPAAARRAGRERPPPRRAARVRLQARAQQA